MPTIVIASVAAVLIIVLIPVVVPTTIVVAATSTTASPALVVASITAIIRLTIVCSLQHPGDQFYNRQSRSALTFISLGRSAVTPWSGCSCPSLSITNFKCRSLATLGRLTFSADYLAPNIGRVE